MGLPVIYTNKYLAHLFLWNLIKSEFLLLVYIDNLEEFHRT